MKKICKYAAVMCTLVVLLVASYPLAATAAPTVKTLHIGCMGAVTGPYAGAYGTPAKVGQMQIDAINKAGGLLVGGVKYLLEFHVYDDQNKPDLAAKGIRELVDRYHPQFLVGATATHVIRAIYGVIKQHKILTLSGCSGHVFGPDWPWMVNIMPGGLRAKAMYGWFAKNKPEIKKVGFCTEDVASAHDMEKEVRKICKEYGMEFQGAEYFQPGAKDIYPQLMRVLGRKPDMLDTSGAYGAGFGSICKQARELGFKGPVVTNSTLSPSIWRVGGPETMENAWYVGNLDAVGKFSNPLIKKFKREYTDKYGWSDFAWWPSWGIPALVAAIKAADSVDPAKVEAAILAGLDFKDQYGFRVVFGGKNTWGTNCQIFMPIHMWTVRSGKMVCVGRLSTEKFLTAAGEEAP